MLVYWPRRIFFVLVVAGMLTSGCVHPGILTKGIGAKGVVIDQNGKPVPNASLVAVRHHCIPIPPFNLWFVVYVASWRTEKSFRADEYGRWSYRTRNITTFETIIRSVGASGYRGGASTGYLDGLFDADRDVVFLLEKIDLPVNEGRE